MPFAADSIAAFASQDNVIPKDRLVTAMCQELIEG